MSEVKLSSGVAKTTPISKLYKLANCDFKCESTIAEVGNTRGQAARISVCHMVAIAGGVCATFARAKL